MNNSLIAAIAVAVLLVFLFLLRKSSKKAMDSTPEDRPAPVTEVPEEKREGVEESLQADFEPESSEQESRQGEVSAEGEQEQEEELPESSTDDQGMVDAVDEEAFEEILRPESRKIAADTESLEIDQEEERIFLEDENQEDDAVDEQGQLADNEELIDELITDEPESDILDEQVLVEEEEAATADESTIPTLTIEIYETYLRKREQKQQEALALAIKNGDDIKRDHLQIELVAITDKIALLDDSYNLEMKWRGEALGALGQLADKSDPSLIQEVKESLLSGKTEAAERFLTKIVDKQGANGALAAFLAGHLAEARIDLYPALERYRKAVELAGDNCDYLQAAGVMARKLYRYRDARPLLEKLVQLLEKQDENSVELALARRELGYTYALSGGLKLAGPLYKQAMKTIADSLGAEHLEMGLSWSQIAELQEAKGQYEQAEPTYSKALAIMEKALGREHPALDYILEKLAGLDAELEDDDKAAILYQRLCAIREKSLGATHPKLAMALQNLAESYRLQGQYEASEDGYQKALAIMEENHGENHPAVAAILQELARLCTRQKKNDEAERLQKRASEIFERSIQDREENINEEDLNLQAK